MINCQMKKILPDVVISSDVHTGILWHFNLFTHHITQIPTEMKRLKLIEYEHADKHCAVLFEIDWTLDSPAFIWAV